MLASLVCAAEINGLDRSAPSERRFRPTRPLSQSSQTNVEPRKRRDSDFRAVLFSAANFSADLSIRAAGVTHNGSSELAAITTPFARVKAWVRSGSHRSQP